MLQRPSLPHTPGPQTPTSPPCLTPQASQVLLPPLPAFAGTQVKISFFFLFFRFFSDQCYRDPLYPTRRVLNPLSLHHIIPTPVPRPSSLVSPRRRLCFTARKPVAASIFATCKSAATATPSLCTRSAHDADPPRASPAVAPPQHGTQDPNTANPSRTSPAVAPPQHGTQGPATANLPRRQHGAQDPTTTPQRQHVAQDPATTPSPTRYAKWSSGGDGGGGGQWDGGGGDGSDGEALLLPQTVHILSVQ